MSKLRLIFRYFLFYLPQISLWRNRVLFLVGLLTVVGFPGTFCDLDIRENCLERRLLGRACVDTELDLVGGLIHVADSHLAEILAVG